MSYNYNKLRSIFIDNIIFLDYYKNHELKLYWPIFLRGVSLDRDITITPLLEKLIITQNNEVAGYINFPGIGGWLTLKSIPSKAFSTNFEDGSELWDAIFDVVIVSLKREWENCPNILSTL